MLKILQKKIKVLEALLDSSDKRCLMFSYAVDIYRDENDKLKEELEKLYVEKSVTIPFIAETKVSLNGAEKEIVDAPMEQDENGCFFCDETVEFREIEIKAAIKRMNEKEAVDAPISFSSRFMANVKFKIPVGIDLGRMYGLEGSFGAWSKDGLICSPILDIQEYNLTDFKEVNYLESMPELVPDGMVYDKDSDSLVEETKDNGEKFSAIDGSFFDTAEEANSHDFITFMNDPDKLKSFLAKKSHFSSDLKLPEFSGAEKVGFSDDDLILLTSNTGVSYSVEPEVLVELIKNGELTCKKP